MHPTAFLLLANDRIADLLDEGRRNRLVASERAARPEHPVRPELPAVVRLLGRALRALPRATAG